MAVSLDTLRRWQRALEASQRATMFEDGPFSFADQGEVRAVEREIERAIADAYREEARRSA